MEMSYTYRVICLWEPYLLSSLASRLNIEFALCIYQTSIRKQVTASSVSLPFQIEIMDHDKLVQAAYDEKVLSQLPAIDRKILEEMRIYEPEIMAVIYRWLNLEFLEIRHHYQKHLKFWYWYLNRHNINLAIIGAPPHESYYSVIYYLCKILDIRTILMYPLSLKNLCLLMEDWKLGDTRVLSTYQSLKQSCTLDALREWTPEFKIFYQEQEQQKNPAYIVSQLELLKGRRLVNFLRKSDKNIIEMLLTKFLYKAFLKLYRRHIKFKHTRWSKTRFFQELMDISFDLFYESICTISGSTTLNQKEQYIYVPLHYQPECSTLPLGEFFDNQLLLLDWLRHCKPQGVMLYVKEHPSQNLDWNTSRYRPLRFYEEILKMPDVCLVSRRMSSFDLIKGSVCVATVTGTVALEALYHKKPVLMFGYHTYQYAPGVFAIRSLGDCSLAMQRIFQENFLPDAVDFLYFMKALEKNALVVDWDELKFSENLRCHFVDHLCNFIEYASGDRRGNYLNW